MLDHLSRGMFLLATIAICMAPAACDASMVENDSPLHYRIASFHRGRADKALIRRAAELGFNGVQFQLEGSTVHSLRDFAERNRKEGYIDLCHSLGMKVTIWVHELSDIAGEKDPGYLGPIELGNEKLWKHLEDRYEWLLGDLLPDVDGLVLTVVETQIRATDTKMMLKLADLIRDKCRKYNKQFVVRTFVWHPDEFEGVMGCVKQLPEDVVIMTKCVPQDWQMRGIHDKAIGNVGNHQQIVEYDVMGEYFLTDRVANCFPDLLKKQFDYGLTKGVDGICVRVDRFDTEVLHEPQEVNMWALGMFATGGTRVSGKGFAETTVKTRVSGKGFPETTATTAKGLLQATDTGVSGKGFPETTVRLNDVWKAWASARYGKDAAAGVIRALKPTGQVVTECLNIGSFSFGDTRGFAPAPEKDAFMVNWANFRWDEAYIPEYKRALAGDPAYIRKIESQKRKALQLARQSLADLEKVKVKLHPADYEILKTKLIGNLAQLQYRGPMHLAYLRYRRFLNTTDPAEKQSLAARIRDDLAVMRAVADAPYPASREIEHLGRKWQVGPPKGLEPVKIREWADRMEGLISAS